MNAIGSARASAGGASPARELWKQREPPHARGERDDGQREVQPVARATTVSASVARPKITALRPTARFGPRRAATSDRQEGRREDGGRRDAEVGVRCAEERQLERRAERAEICEEEKEPDDPKGHLADHARESIACPICSG